MMIEVREDELTGDCEMRLDGETIGRCANTSFIEAVDAFAANWPEHASRLDELKADDVAWLAGSERHAARRTTSSDRTVDRRPGSGKRFRELMAGGATNAEALAVVRAEFPQSKATLSDAAWNRARLQKETAARVSGLGVAGNVGELL